MDNIEKIKILYLDDEENNLSAFKVIFRRDFDITTSSSPEDAITLVRNEPFHVVISDQRMPVMTGTQFFEHIIDLAPEPIRILLTGYADIEAVIDAINKGEVYRYITKPWNTDEMKTVLHNAYELYDLRRENERLMEELKEANEKLEFIARQNLLS